MRRFLFALNLSLLIVLSACGGSGSAPDIVSSNTPEIVPTKLPPTVLTSTPEVAIIVLPTTDESAVVPRQLIEQAKAHLANLLNLETNQIRVVEALTVSWPDTSLGCPQPGLYYAQMIIPGYRIVLEAAGKQYPYHTDLQGRLILCKANKTIPTTETPTRPLLPVNPTEIQDGQPWMPVN